MKTLKLIPLLLLCSILTVSAQNIESDTLQVRQNEIGISFSMLSFSGFHYTRTLNESLRIKTGGYFHYNEHQSGVIEFNYELGMELQHILREFQGLALYSLIGTAYVSEKPYMQSTIEWLKLSGGVGIRRLFDNGFSFHAETGLRFRSNIGGQGTSSGGFAVGAGIGYSF